VVKHLDARFTPPSKNQALARPFRNNPRRGMGPWRSLTLAAANQSLLKGKRIKDAFVLYGAIMLLAQSMICGTFNEMISGNNVW
jgi:hypothetical protein